MLTDKFSKIIREREWLPVAALLLLGFALRFCGLGSCPWGLNQDEASAGYEAWALLQSGTDRCGSAWPVLFISWGSGQNVLMSYLAMPFIALFGLNELTVRLPNAISGCLSLIVFWLFARRAGGKGFGIFALFILCVNPWHIMMSRWALESNQLPFFLLLGIYFTSRAKERPFCLLPAAAAFGLALYAYGTAFFFLPIFLIAAVVWLGRDFRMKSFLPALGIFIIIAMPVSLCQLRNALGLEGMSLFGLTLPKLTEGRQAATSVFGGGGIRAAIANFSSFLKILWTQTDGLSFNSMPLRYGGLFYFFGLPTSIAGAALCFARRRRDAGQLMLTALLCGVLCAFFIDCNINRINMVWLPCIYFSALGSWWILCKVKKLIPAAAAVMLCCFVLFCANYKTEFENKGNSSFFPGLGEAIEYCLDSGCEDIYISNYVNQPYIFALFYSETSPEKFIDTVDYPYPKAAFRPVRSFGIFRFGAGERADGELSILHRSQVGEREVLFSSGQYCVCN